MQSQQTAEKLLKHVIDKEYLCGATKDAILHSHKIKSLLRFLSSKYDITNVKNTSEIDNVYFDTRYPSDDYYEVTSDVAFDCLDYVNNLIKWLIDNVDIETLFDLYLEVHHIREARSKRHTREFLHDMLF